MLRFAAVIACALMVVGCAGAQHQPTDGPPVANLPANYREMIAAHVKSTFFDPYSIRDAAISNSVDTTSIFGPVTNVCIKANGKNRMGGYVGMRYSGYVFQAGRIQNVLEDQLVAGSCANRAYEPFYEIDSVAKPPAPQKPAPATKPRRG